MTEELKPCPFCGESPYVYRGPPNGVWLVRCEELGCPNKFRGGIAVDLWNTRPIEDALRAEIADLSRWIPVAEKQPDNGQRVWGLRRERDVYEYVWVGQKNITHWHPFPELPE